MPLNQAKFRVEPRLLPYCVIDLPQPVKEQMRSGTRCILTTEEQGYNYLFTHRGLV